MLMNAQPRVVSKNFRTFVPTYRVEPSNPGLLEMTKNEINAWNTFGPVPFSLSPQNWDYQLGRFGNEENYLASPVVDTYSESSDDLISYSQFQPNIFPISFAPNGIENSLQHTIARHDLIQAPNDRRSSQASYFQASSPMIALNSRNWASSQTIEAFSKEQMAANLLASSCNAFSNEQITANVLARSSVRDTDFRTVTILPESAYLQHSETLKATPGSVRSFDSTSSNSSSYLSSQGRPSGTWADPSDIISVQDISIDPNWWNCSKQGSDGSSDTDRAMPFLFDGLPSNFACSTWYQSSDAHVPWSQQAAPFNTVSPQSLTINATSTSGPLAIETSNDLISKQSPVVALMASPAIASTHVPQQVDSYERSPSEKAVTCVPVSRPRQKLPDHPISQRCEQTVAAQDFTSSRTQRRQSPKNKMQGLTSKHANYSLSSAQQNDPAAKVPGSAQKSTEKRIEPKLASEEIESISNKSPEVYRSVQNRTAKDEFLVRSKLAGMSYGEIRRKGGFSEAESTLRGRYRTLTKDKNERVRRPEWTEQDLHLLKRAVRKFSNHNSKPKIPWKQVADYIIDNGGSYRFGYATCRRRWDELHRRIDL